MSAKIWIDGQFVDKLEARVGLFDHGFLYGDGIVEDMRLRQGSVFQLENHLARLVESSLRLELPLPYSVEKLRSIVLESINENRRSEGLIRVIVTRGAGTLGPDPRKCSSSLIVIAEDLLPIPRELVEHGIHLISLPFHENHSDPRLFRRTLSGVGLVRGKAQALRRGCFDAAYVDDSGIVGTVEGTLFAILEGTVLESGSTAMSWDDVYASAVRTRLQQSGLRHERRPITLDELARCDEAFVVGTGVEIIAAIQLDHISVGGGREGKRTRELRESLYAPG